MDDRKEGELVRAQPAVAAAPGVAAAQRLPMRRIALGVGALAAVCSVAKAILTRLFGATEPEPEPIVETILVAYFEWN